MSANVTGEARLYVPRPNPHTAKYWANLAEGRFTVARCQECARWTHPPLETCRWCGGPLVFEEVSGRGTVYSFSTMHYGSGAVFPNPYTVAVVDLDEQERLRVVGRLILPADVEPRIGMPVQHEIVALGDTEVRVLAFQPL